MKSNTLLDNNLTSVRVCRVLWAPFKVVIATFIACLLMTSPLFSVVAFADEDSNDASSKALKLDIKVGYAGQKPEIRKSYTPETLRKLGIHKQFYTYITRVGTIRLQGAEGVYLKDIINDAKIDINSIARIHFTSSDSYEPPVELTLGNLFQTRYYYPKLIQNWDFDNSEAKAGAAEGAKAVQTMLSFRQDFQRVGENYNMPSSVDEILNNSEANENTRFRLCLGMTDTKSATSMLSIKWISSVEITLAGSPPKDNSTNKKAGETETSGADKTKNKNKRTIGSKAAPKTTEPKTLSKAQDGGALGNQKGDAASKDASAADILNRKLSLLELESENSISTANGTYQPWRAGDMSGDASAYSPGATYNSMAIPTSASIGGLFLIGAIAQLRRRR